MSAQIHKAFFVCCTKCHFQEVCFEKKEARMWVRNHDCVKHLKKQWLLSHPGILNNFIVTIEEKVSRAPSPVNAAEALAASFQPAQRRKP